MWQDLCVRSSQDFPIRRRQATRCVSRGRTAVAAVSLQQTHNSISGEIQGRGALAMEFQPTDEQQAILQHDPENHARVLAGPGTGKSTTMVALLDSLLEKDKALRVRMLTFTRAATSELAEKFPGGSDNAPRPSTIHSFAISILLRNPGTGGFPEPLRIADTWEYKNIIRPTLAKRRRGRCPKAR